LELLETVVAATVLVWAMWLWAICPDRSTVSTAWRARARALTRAEFLSRDGWNTLLQIVSGMADEKKIVRIGFVMVCDEVFKILYLRMKGRGGGREGKRGMPDLVEAILGICRRQKVRLGIK